MEGQARQDPDRKCLHRVLGDRRRPGRGRRCCHLRKVYGCKPSEWRGRRSFRRCRDTSKVHSDQPAQVIALAAWWHGWKRDDFDQLARCLVAGHLIECGCYVVPSPSHPTSFPLPLLILSKCGGNFAGFQQMGESFHDVSFPIAEITIDGSCIIQKQPNQNGMNVCLISLLLTIRTNDL